MPTRISTTCSVRRSMLVALLIVGAGCDSRDTHIETRPAPTPSNVDSWLGKWTGPEGTYLLLSKRANAIAQYGIEIKSLDGIEIFIGSARDGNLEFERNGKLETVRATDGKGTGMKWLLDKRDCIAIQVGEGFCRD